MSPNAGSVLADRFELQELAGKGGMGQVWRARDRTSGDLVALKLILGASAEAGERFAREAFVLATLSHASIVRYVDHGVAPSGEPWLAMEWLAGEDLSRRLETGALAFEEARAIGLRVCEALDVAHELGVVHRDIKPSNIWLVERDCAAAKVLDFGIARVAGLTLAATRAGRPIGTPGYMAPEQARGALALDARTDLFALGCVLFEMLAGRPAFVGEHPIAVLAKVLFEEAPALSALRPDVPAGLADLVARLLAKDPGARPARATDVHRVLSAELDRALSRRAPARSAVGDRELRRLFVVVALGSIDPPPDALEAHAASTLAAPADGTWPALAARLAELGARAERLADGTIVAALAKAGGGSDAAALCARAALAIRASVPAAPMAICTGMGMLDESLPYGEAIDRAFALARVPIEAEAEGTGVRIDEGTAGMLDARFAVAGDRRGLFLFEERDVAERARTLLGRAVPCVGRDRELASLLGALDECIHEPVARAVLVTAPPGVGKSRLCRELLHRVAERDQHVEIFMAHADPVGAGSPFGLLGRLIRRSAGVREDEPESVRWAKLRARIARHVPASEVARVAELMGEISGAASDDPPSTQLAAARQDARIMADLIATAWQDWMRAECAAHPVLVVLEDLHWGDPPTVRYLDLALRSCSEEPLMVLALARPEVSEIFPRLWPERIEIIALRELGKRSSLKLVREALGPDVAEGLAERIATLAAGNAFYLEELVRSVAEGARDALPESVLAMAQLRLEALAPEARRLLRAASVFGETFWRGGLSALLGHDAHLVDAWLPSLIERELVEHRATARFADEADLGFRHALLREAAYGALTADDRARGHDVAARWLEDKGEPDPLVLAEHFQRGEDGDRAAQYFLRAAEQALEGGDLDGAIERARRGRACATPPEPSVTVGRLALLEAEAVTWRDGRELGRPLVDLALAHSPPGSAAWVRALGMRAFAAAIDEQFGLRDTLLGAVIAPDAERTFAICASRLGMQICIARRSSEAAPLFDAIDALPADVQNDPLARGWVIEARGFRAAVAGEIDVGLRCWEEAELGFTRLGDERNALAQRLNQAFGLMAVGQLERAYALMEATAVDAARLKVQRIVQGTVTVRAIVAFNLGWQEQLAELAARGDDPTAMTFAIMGSGDVERVSALLQIVAERAPGPDWRVPRAALLLADGRPHEALAVLATADPPGLFGSIGLDAGERGFVRVRALEVLGEKERAREALRQTFDEVCAQALRIAAPELRQGFLFGRRDHRQVMELAREWLGLEPPS